MGEAKVNKEQEAMVTMQVRREMQKIRNDSITTGMRSALAVVLNYCNKDGSAEEKIEEIKEFCKKGLGE